MTAPLRVRVGIVSWNTSALLDRCLAALPEALAGLEATVVVVDNASADRSAETAAGHRDVTVIRNPDNVGYARAMNQALAGDADVLVALNPDTEPPPGSLARLVAHLVEDPGLGLVAPRLSNPDGSLQHSVHRFPSPRQAAVVLLVPRWLQRHLGIGRRWWTEGLAPHDRSTDVDWAVGAVHVVRDRALRGERPYAERWFMYVEDLDLCWRLRTSGWRCRLAADVAVPHVGDASGRQAWGDARTARWLDASYDWYAGVHGRSAMRRWAAVNVAAVTVHAFLAAVGANGDRARSLVGLLPRHVGALLTGPPPLAPARVGGGPPRPPVAGGQP